MDSKPVLVGRWLALAIVSGHLLLAGAAAPHRHERAVEGRVADTNEHPHPHRHHRPHVHWGALAHGHADDASDRREAGLPQDHDDDAIDLAADFLAVGVGPIEPATPGPTTWAALPPEGACAAAAASRIAGALVRPPGEARPRFHDRMPLVLRV